jgi:hypothetical protein
LMECDLLLSFKNFIVLNFFAMFENSFPKL